ncbi:MAG: AhpC/TSA family protein [Betaproteobacteria bacterium]|nr:AhpC/TSA family protein [Betaproteobacteria bacterium]
MSLMPRKSVPALEVETLGGGRWKLFAQKPQNFSMIVFYRGLHCPVCRKYTSELNGLIGEFDKRGVSTLVTSTDVKERAEQAKTQWGLPNLTVGYGVSIESARQWGLYVSTGRGMTSAGIEEPPLFAEPGLFLVKPDATLYWASYSTMPFARPHFNEILSAIDFVVSKNYPARGEA